MQQYNHTASKSSQAYINIRFGKGEVGGVGSWCTPDQTVCSSALERDWPWDSCWNVANYVLKILKPHLLEKNITFPQKLKASLPFYVKQENSTFFLGISAFLYFVLLCLRQWQNSQERSDEDVLSTWKNDAVCCLSSWCVREKENPLPALELRGWEVAVSMAEPLCVPWFSLSLSWQWWCLPVRHAVQCFIGPTFVGSLGCSCSWKPKALHVFHVCAGCLLPLHGVCK